MPAEVPIPPQSTPRVLARIALLLVLLAVELLIVSFRYDAVSLFAAKEATWFLSFWTSMGSRAADSNLPAICDSDRASNSSKMLLLHSMYCFRKMTKIFWESTRSPSIAIALVGPLRIALLLLSKVKAAVRFQMVPPLLAELIANNLIKAEANRWTRETLSSLAKNSLVDLLETDQVAV